MNYVDAGKKHIYMYHGHDLGICSLILVNCGQV